MHRINKVFGNMKIKKTIKILGHLIFSTMIIVSCRNKAKDIQLTDLKTNCDIVEAWEVVFDEEISIIGDKSFEDISDEESIKIGLLELKITEISGAGSKFFSWEEAKKCFGFKRMWKQANKVGSLITWP